MRNLTCSLFVLLCAGRFCLGAMLVDSSVPEPPPGFVLEDSEPNNDHANAQKDGASEKWMPRSAVAVDPPANAQRGVVRLDELRKEAKVNRFEDLVNDDVKNSLTPGEVAACFLVLVAGGLGLSFVCWFIRPGVAQNAPESYGLNRKQRVCLHVGIIIFVLMGLFPPYYDPRGGNGYMFLFAPLFGDRAWPVDIHRLCVQWLIVAALLGGLMSKFHEPKATTPPNESRS